MGIIACLLNFILSFQISSNFKNFSILFIAFFGFIVLNIEVLSLFKMINGENILILTLIEFLIVHLYWLKKKKPVCLPNFKGFLVDLKKAFNEDGYLILTTGALLFFILIAFILAILSPVTEPDATSYHCLRSLFWLKDGFISHFEVSDIRCHSMPINSELFYVWILALFKKDTLFGLLQFCSYFLLLFSSFNIMEFYNIEFKKRIWALIIFSSFAGVISQISSTQTDLCVGALLSCSIYLIHYYIKDKRLSLLFFSSLCMGLSFGVKSTGVIGSIPLIVWYIVLLRKDFIKYFIFLCFNFIVFSSYNYILNFINYGNFLGSNSALLGHGFWGGIKGGIANFIRYIFQLFDFSGLSLGLALNDSIINFRDKILSALSIPTYLGVNAEMPIVNAYMTEQYSGFGILGILVFLPSIIIGFFNKKLRTFSIIFLTTIIILSFTLAYMIYSIRFFITFACVAIPLLSLTYTNKMNLYKFLVVIYIVFYLCYASLFMSQRPMAYLFQDFLKTKSITTIQEKMHTLSYRFYPVQNRNESELIKFFVSPYCKNENKIGLFLSNSAMFYTTKYLDLNNNCKIDSLNPLHIDRYDLKKYDVILKQKDSLITLQSIDKKDIKNGFIENEKVDCHFLGYDEIRQPKIIDNHKLDLAIDAKCKINVDYLIKEGFKSQHYAEIPYAGGHVKDLELWVR